MPAEVCHIFKASHVEAVSRVGNLSHRFQAFELWNEIRISRTFKNRIINFQVA